MPSRHGEAGVLEHPQHRLVRRHHLGDERLDAGAGRKLCELLEQPRADAVALELVGDREGDLRRRGVAKPHVARERHDPLLRPLAERADQRAALGPVRIEEGRDELGRQRGKAVKALVHALVGESSKEREHRLGVVGVRRPQPQRAAVAEDDVANELHRECHVRTIDVRLAASIGPGAERGAVNP